MENRAQTEFTVKKEDIKEVVVTTKLYYWHCQVCNKMMSSFSRDKLLSAIKLHLMRAHGAKTVAFE
jgi:hypothetical protein